MQNDDVLYEDAKESDRRLDCGEARLLEGVPVAVKDNYSTRALRTTCASKMLDQYTPTFDATLVARLRSAGAIIIGKTNMDEFSMGSASNTGAYGPVVNPWSASSAPEDAVVAGGSSGGSAAAVSARVVSAALGSDTGGSIRLPAAYCGVVGFKPSYGVLSRHGLIAYASSLDTPGFFTQTAQDASLLLDVLAARDPLDSTSIDLPAANADRPLASLRFGVPSADYLVAEMSPEIIALWRDTTAAIEAAGGTIVPISLPNTRHALPAYYILATSEASSNLARYDGMRFGSSTATPTSLTDMYKTARTQGFGDEVKRRILLGTMALSRGSYDNYYTKAQSIRRLVSNDFSTAFSSVDVIITPTAPSSAFKLNEPTSPIDMYINDILTIPANLAGLPSVSLPLRLSSSQHPLGLQLISSRLSDHTLLQAAHPQKEKLNDLTELVTYLVYGCNFIVPKRYTVLKCVGHGAYGVVCAAFDNVKETKVAIKKITKAFDNVKETKRTLREIHLLRHFNHENIISILDMLKPPSKADFEDVYIISELMDTDLHNIISSPQKLSDDHINYFVYQILRGMKHIHSANVLHRDLSLDLLDKMLTFDPAKRITVEDALRHPYMKLMHDPTDEPICLHQFNLNFEGWDLNRDLLKELVYNEILNFHPQEAQPASN
eukprot:gene396-465_t